LKYPKWVHEDVISWYEALEEKDPKLDAIALRLINRPEMEKVWNWISTENLPLSPIVRGGIIGRLFYWIDTFNNTIKKPYSERIEDYKEIKRLALDLSRKLKLYQNEVINPDTYVNLIPIENQKLLFSFLSPEIQKKNDESKWYEGRFVLWDYILPPLSELLEGLAKRVDISDAKLNDNFPTKIRQDSALRSYLINNYLSNGYPVLIISILLSVALDDPSLNEDIVRKAQISKRTFSE
jgi:hypothetical protein